MSSWSANTATTVEIGTSDIQPKILAKIDVTALAKVYGALFILLVIGFGLAMFFE